MDGKRARFYLKAQKGTLPVYPPWATSPKKRPPSVRQNAGFDRHQHAMDHGRPAAPSDGSDRSPHAPSGPTSPALSDQFDAADSVSGEYVAVSFMPREIFYSHCTSCFDFCFALPVVTIIAISHFLLFSDHPAPSAFAISSLWYHLKRFEASLSPHTLI